MPCGLKGAEKKTKVTSGASFAHLCTSSNTFRALSLRVLCVIFLDPIDLVTKSLVRHLFVPGISRSNPALMEWSMLYTPNLYTVYHQDELREKRLSNRKENQSDVRCREEETRAKNVFWGGVECCGTSHVPIAHRHALKAPLFPQDIAYEVCIFRGVGAVHAIVTRNQGNEGDEY